MNYKLSCLLLLTATVDYFLFQKLYEEKEKKRKIYLIISILVNFTPLIAFKFLATFHDYGLFGSATVIQIPIGISFYTFKSVGALVDTYNKRIDKPTNYLEFLFFVTYFPALLCGPVSRLGQFQKNFEIKSFKGTYLLEGFTLILTGLFKKICIADMIHHLIIQTFEDNSQQLGLITSWSIMSAHLVQVYFDFSGYTDIARGVGRLFGHSLIENFKYSLVQKNIGEFWRKHHISMTEWFRDYIYLPLLQVSPYMKHPLFSMTGATIVTFFVSGLWHKFDWTGVIFGLSQGAFIAIFSVFKIKTKIKLLPIFSWFLTYFSIALSTNFLIASSPELLSQTLKGAFSLNWNESIPWMLIAVQVILLVNMLMLSKGMYKAVLDFISKRSWLQSLTYGAYATVLTLMIAIMANEKVNFIYYQF